MDFLTDLKLYLFWNAVDESEDALLNLLLASAFSFTETFLKRKIESKNFTEIYNWQGEYEFLLKNFPVSSLTSFKYNTGTFSSPIWTDFDPDTYRLEWSCGKIWLTFSLNKGLQNIQTVYTAWYTEETLPNDLKQAIIFLAAYYYDTRGSNWLVSENVDWTGVVYDKKWIPEHILVILNKYKNV